MSQPEMEGTLTQTPRRRVLSEVSPTPAVSHLDVLIALVALVLVDVTLHTRGYRRIRLWLSRCATNTTRVSASPDGRTAVLAAVDRAAVFYPRKAMCLQRSAAITWMLRRRGLPAQMVIGCRHTPFYAHAWVELDGSVVNDRVEVRSLYPELERT